MIQGIQILFYIIGVRKLEHFNQKKEHAEFCPKGQGTFEDVAELMRLAVLRCRKQKIKKLLINSTGLSGLRPPRFLERYQFANSIASDASGKVKIAHVASRAWVRSGKFSILVAKNRGLDAENFLSEPDAMKWLLKTDTKLPPENA